MVINPQMPKVKAVIEIPRGSFLFSNGGGAKVLISSHLFHALLIMVPSRTILVVGCEGDLLDAVVLELWCQVLNSELEKIKWEAYIA